MTVQNEVGLQQRLASGDYFNSWFQYIELSHKAQLLFLLGSVVKEPINIQYQLLTRKSH